MLANAAAQCEKPLHGGGCQKDECNNGCVAKYGAGSYGYSKSQMTLVSAVTIANSYS
jgi:hypothetical protein